VNEGDVVGFPRFLACRVAENFLHFQRRRLLRESLIESHDSDGPFQIAEVFINVRAGQDAVPPTVLNQDATSLRGWRLARSGKADSVVLHPVEHGVRNFFAVRNLFGHVESDHRPRSAGASCRPVPHACALQI
jgi:hypothetical protein